jgi:hypothetical protein
MATPAQIRANRANAQNSTGPRTEAGRQTTRNNALKHGLAAAQLVLPAEDPAALEALRADLNAEHQPPNLTEAMLVEEVAVCWWRLLRARKSEVSGIKATFMAKHPYALAVMDSRLRYTAAAERAWNRALTQLRAAQNDRRKREQSDGAAAPSPQPQESKKVMTVGSVLQNTPARSEPAPDQPVAAPKPPAIEPAVAEQQARRGQNEELLIVAQARIDQMREFVKQDLRRTGR